MKNIITLAFFLVLLFSFNSFSDDYKTEIFATQEKVIWGFDFLKDGKVVFSEKSGNLYLFDPKTKTLTLISGTPKVLDEGQGGLLDVKVHPTNGYIYLTYSEKVGEDKSTTALGRGKLDGSELTFEKLFSAQPASSNTHHYGSRVVFDGKGHLFLSIGERGERPWVQKLDTHIGKIIRLNEDGSVPKDNPYVGVKNALPEIWSYGHRNPQGMSMRSGTEELWVAEMGPKGGDEINLIEPKNNYGWPVITYGREYTGGKIGEGKKKKGMEEPVHYWVPSISPSGMTFYTGDKMPEWKGNMFLGLLSGEHIRRVILDGTKVKDQEELLKDLGWRFRQVRTGPDGYLWFSTDDGKLGRVLKK
ncbi:MAG: PQQ-dependent sugar dehydrogenase [Bacteriovoracia bacterium]